MTVVDEGDGATARRRTRRTGSRRGRTTCPGSSRSATTVAHRPIGEAGLDAQESSRSLRGDAIDVDALDRFGNVA